MAEILGLDAFDEYELYEALDWLAQYQNRIEKKLFRAYAKKKGSPNVLVLYDVTSSYLEGDCNELAEYGFCRDKKKGKKQIVIGLLTGADGEPLSIKVFKGNTNDCMTVWSQIETLKRRFGVEDVIFVGDRGMVKSKGKAALSENGLRYITALTNPQVRKLLGEGVIQLDLFDERVCEVEYGDLRLVLRRNEQARRKEERRREDKLARLRELVDERNAFVAESPRSRPEAGLTKLINWSKRYKISYFVSLTLERRQLVLTVDERAKIQAGQLDGCYVLETDVAQDRMDATTVDERYRSLQRVERNFRTLKTGFLEIRPIYVRKAARTAGHALVSMLALKIVNEAERLLKDSFSCSFSLHDALSTMSRLCFRRHQVKGKEFLSLPAPDEAQAAVCNALAIRPPRAFTLKGLLAEAAST